MSNRVLMRLWLALGEFYTIVIGTVPRVLVPRVGSFVVDVSLFPNMLYTRMPFCTAFSCFSGVYRSWYPRTSVNHGTSGISRKVR